VLGFLDLRVPSVDLARLVDPALHRERGVERPVPAGDDG